MNEESGAKVFLMPLAEIQPSQLYISQEKLITLQEEIDLTDLSAIPPNPIKKLGDEIVMTDGHTRAFGVHLAGHDKLMVYWDRDELDWQAYQICVDWCHEEGIHSIGDLEGRVISPEDYEELWYQRCRVMQSDLAESRKQ